MILALHIEITIPLSHSLKEKRAVLQRIMTRTKQKFNVAISEVDFQDQWQRSEICIVTVASVKLASERELNNVLSFISSFPELEITQSTYEWL
ncbi:MAG: hypothetical protein K0S34_2623 [Bacillales bacterium]|jgi:uncharacterized protein YlxP (DUF503 family)|nr:hypothetical protein [Bacillales bacterium]